MKLLIFAVVTFQVLNYNHCHGLWGYASSLLLRNPTPPVPSSTLILGTGFYELLSFARKYVWAYAEIHKEDTKDKEGQVKKVEEETFYDWVKSRASSGLLMYGLNYISPNNYLIFILYHLWTNRNSLEVIMIKDYLKREHNIDLNKILAFLECEDVDHEEKEKVDTKSLLTGATVSEQDKEKIKDAGELIYNTLKDANENREEYKKSISTFFASAQDKIVELSNNFVVGFSCSYDYLNTFSGASRQLASTVYTAVTNAGNYLGSFSFFSIPFYSNTK